MRRKSNDCGSLDSCARTKNSVNAIAPGPTQTGYITPEMEEALLPSIPLRRLGTPADIADVVVMFASEEARWMTGQVVQVAGGHAL
ncbi:MAG TPA: SDR family oxidoreductase [Candidatus Binatia bacterium]|nr:SDR family oxidoreductase [Candidatus Binatia bacterium]